MEPNACLVRLLEALSDGDEREARYAMEDLSEWLRKGCSLPSVRTVGHVYVGRGQFSIGEK